ncbi:serine/threonine-protein kinase VRK1-like [Venturia canescens]|uniref:serine/threonine-protein kinase VRK1-like n=1 Tax=Venturia canescens TaxID=32260 RepID=UPI001C9CBBD4|nr:serine/threonine-protein kinase VRK1-like [Venturia canescens]
MAGKGVKKAPKKKGANGYKLPDPIPKGEIIIDLSKKQWILGESIGIGGFGEIYSAAPYSGKTPKDYPFVIKIEPHGNGPLFVEMHFYMRNAKPEDIEAWRKKKKLQHLGMPKFIGSGSHECHGTKYRFVVMERYGTDLWKLFLENGRKFPEQTVYKIAIQILDVLEYIHSRTYIHADIKGGNLLMDLKSPNYVYLVDFGLASHYTTKPEYKLDPKKAHNGTIEYTSRDAHMGVPTMRSDFEILGYNMVQWLCDSLPWDSNLKDPSAVQKQKEKAFENVENFLKQCFGSRIPSPISEYMKLLAELKFNDTPNYAKFRKILVQGLEKLGCSVDGKLEFGKSAKAPTRPPTVTPMKNKKVTETAVKRKSPRIKASRTPSPSFAVGSSLDESTVGVVVDKKREGVRGLRKIVETMDDDSDAEYDICITKKRKVKKNEEKTMPKATTSRRPRRKPMDLLDSSANSEPEIVTKGTKSRPKTLSNTRGRTVAQRKNMFDDSNTDVDMFGDGD